MKALIESKERQESTPLALALQAQPQATVPLALTSQSTLQPEALQAQESTPRAPTLQLEVLQVRFDPPVTVDPDDPKDATLKARFEPQESTPRAPALQLKALQPQALTLQPKAL